ncbi:hypothetical protein F4775DRAFT_580142 [Biscogniauxia sp. FL1348]|nr:hypothetical protein F4775DRAFT_580142 [Biscogniauxia sp. FL1348]
MAFLLEPNISTADIYTTLSTRSLMLEHDQMTVQWESTDLPKFPSEVAKSYASMMGIEITPTAHHLDPTVPGRLTFPHTTQDLVYDLPSSIKPPTTSFQLAPGRHAGSLSPSPTSSNHLSSSTVSKSSRRFNPFVHFIMVGWLVIIWQLW